MSILNILKPTSASIQKEYVQKRQRVLDRDSKERVDAVEAAVKRLMAHFHVSGDWVSHYARINQQMQDAELTINFDARSWFSQENNFPTYAQMYERAVGKDGKMKLTDADPMNPALARAVVDDLVTLPDEWANAHPFSQRKRIYQAMNATGASQELCYKKSLKTSSAAEIAPKLNAKDGGYGTKNKQFKSKAKQVFAALNFGNRPHGSNVAYGYSHLVLNPSLKRNALYYPCDTFFKWNIGANMQASYKTLASLLQYMSNSSARELWQSCHDSHSLADTDDGTYMIEAHLFQKVKVNRDVQALWLSRHHKKDAQPVTNEEWLAILKNAETYCRRNHIRLILASGVNN